MEVSQRIQTAARKENIPPALNCCGVTKEQRKIQKNINVHLLLSSGSHLGELWTQTGSSIPGSNHLGENVERGLRVPSGRRQTGGLFQTNLFCPLGALDKTALVQQQTNLESNLQRRRWAGEMLKRTPLRGFPERPCDIPRNSSRMKNREQYLPKEPQEHFTRSRRSYEDLKAWRKSSSPSQFSLGPSLHSSPHHCPLPMTFSGISDSAPPGPALTLDSLVDGHTSPEGPQTPIRSSQSCADRCWPLYGLKKERSSFSYQSRSPSWVPQPAREPQISTLAVRKVQSSVEGSSPGQVRSKWRTMVSSTLLTCQEDNYSCLRSSSGTPPTTNKKDELRDQGYLRTIDPEERHSETFCGSELYLKNLPPDVFSLKSLESSLKTSSEESSLSRRLSMDDTHEEMPPTLDPSGVPEAPLGHPLEKNAGDFAAPEVGDKHGGEAGGDLIITSTVDEASLLTALQKVRLFEETIWKSPRKGFQPANTPVWPRYLQKDGGPLRGYFVLLEIKKLGDAFKRWRSHWEKRQQIHLLVFRIQTRLIKRCFRAWQSLAQRKQHSQATMEHLWAQSLRASFRQWGLMVQARRNAKVAVIELLGAKPPSSRGPQRDPSRRNWPPKYTENTLESLLRLRTLRDTFLTWEARCWEVQRAGAFRRGLSLRQLREALGRWRRRTRGLNPLRLTEGCLLALADWQEPPSSSSALPRASQAVQPVEPSLIGLTSLGTVDKSSSLPAPTSRCPNCSFDRENPTRVTNRASPLRLNWQAASKYGQLWKRSVQLHHFQAGRDARQLAKAWMLWKDACSTELAAQTLRWWRGARWVWKMWRRRWLQLQVAQRFREAEEEQLLRTAFGKWRRLAAVSRVQTK